MWPQLPHSAIRNLLDDGAIDVLVPLVRGSLTWMEAQQATRALCKLAQASPVAATEIVQAGGVAALARAATTAFDEVAQQNLLRPRRSFLHHADMLSRGNMDDRDCRALYVREMRELRQWAVEAIAIIAAQVPPSEADVLAPQLACKPVLSMIASFLLSNESWRRPPHVRARVGRDELAPLAAGRSAAECTPRMGPATRLSGRAAGRCGRPPHAKAAARLDTAPPV